MRDITTFMEQFITLILNAFIWIFETLDSIKFSGISLLQYIITLIILGVILPILFTIPKINRTEKRGAKKDGTK